MIVDDFEQGEHVSERSVPTYGALAGVVRDDVRAP